MNLDVLLPFLGGILATAAGTYVGFYLKGASARRKQIAESLAAFYSGTAVAYYAARDFHEARENATGDQFLEIGKRFDDRYKEFLAASTTLASLVPPALREEVLAIEDFWDEMYEKGFSEQTAKTLFDTLDSIRERILESIAYSRFTDPFWKTRISSSTKGIVGISVATVVLLGLYWYSCRLSGDVFLVSDAGKAEIAPGALIAVFPQTSDQSTAKFMLSPATTAVHEEYSNRFIENLKNSPIEIAKVQNQAEGQVYCGKIRSGASKFFGEKITSLTADQHGKFSLRLPPGSYSVMVSGQAGTKDGLWLEDVQVNWRSEVHFAKPVCESGT